jgi:hypothetical protein
LQMFQFVSFIYVVRTLGVGTHFPWDTFLNMTLLSSC